MEPSGTGARTLTAGDILARARRLWPLLLSLGLLLSSLAAALRTALRGTDGHLVYALDDAYIHMAVAKTLANHGIWGCTPFHFSSSSSSLLWTLVLGAADRAFGVHDWTPLLLNVAFAIATLLVADVSMGRFGVPAVARASTLLGIVVAFPLSGMVLMGMEHILHLLLTIAFAAAAVLALTTPRAAESQPAKRRRTLALCLLGALLGASRYEGLFLIGLVCLALLVRRQLARALSIGFSSLLPVVAFGAISVANGSYFLPNPLMVKAVGETASPVSALFKPFGSEDLDFLRWVGYALGGGGLVALGTAAALGIRAHDLDQESQSQCRGESCSAAGKSLRDRAFGAATGSTIAAVAGGALLAAGVTWLFFVPAPEQPGRLLGFRAQATSERVELKIGGAL
jgi:hypothetical protein